MAEGSIRRQPLPAPLSRFVGRKQEIYEIRQHLAEYRLVTLTGPGGIGKTRLAVQAAAAERDRFAAGVWLVELAALAQPELVAETVANTLDLPQDTDLPAPERLAAYMRDKHLLLVIDNCEHVLDACARLVALLLSHSPGLTILTTSREPLSISGEAVLRVPPLRLPDSSAPLDASLLDYEAVQLFVDRAQAAEPSFRFAEVTVATAGMAATAGTAGAVVEICRRLDGIPLAIELAAVRVRGLGVTDLAERLDQRFQILTEGDRTALPRQQTLQAMIDWSARLLPEAEQVLLRRLGVFRGGFIAAAAESVCAGAYHDPREVPHGSGFLAPEAILPHLLHLLNASLVQWDPATGRYALLETIRLFSLERLAEASESEDVHRQHLEWYLQWAERGAPLLTGTSQEKWIARLEQEQEDVRAALEWAIAAGKAEEAARLALAVWPFWQRPISLREGLSWLEQILALDATNAATTLPTALRPRLYNALGVLSANSSQFGRATAYHAEALRLWSEMWDRGGMAQALLDSGWQQFREAHIPEAIRCAEESLALARDLGDQRAIALALSLKSTALLRVGQVEEALPTVEESLALWRELGETRNLSSAIVNMALVESRRGNYDQAKALLAEAFRLLVQVGPYQRMMGHQMALLELALQSTDQPAGARVAAQVLGMLAAIGARIGRPSPWWGAPMQDDIARVRALLGDRPFDQAFAKGQQMTLADLAQLAEQICAPAPARPAVQSSPSPAAPMQAGLTARELEVLHLVAGGLTNAQVAQALSVTSHTVNAHLTAIYGKLGVTSRAGAIRYALEHQLG